METHTPEHGAMQKGVGIIAAIYVDLSDMIFTLIFSTIFCKIIKQTLNYSDFFKFNVKKGLKLIALS